MGDKNLRSIHQQLIIAEEAEAASVVEIADPERDAQIIAAVAGSGKRKHATNARSASVVVALGGFAVVCIFSFSIWRNGHPTGQSHRPLASYQMHVPGDDSVAGLGSEPQLGATPRLSLDSVLQVDLRPAHRVSGEVEARAFLKLEDRLSVWAVTFDRSVQGTFRLRGKVRDLPLLSPGRWELIFAVGYADRLPGSDELMQQLTRSTAPDEGLQILRGGLEIVASKQSL